MPEPPTGGDDDPDEEATRVDSTSEDGDERRDVGPDGRGDDERVDPWDVLARVESLGLAPRQYDAEADVAGDVEGGGPSADDLSGAFGPGGLEASDEDVGTDQVALAAIRGLAAKVEAQRARLQEQTETIRAHRAVIDEQRDDIESLRERLETLQASVASIRSDVDERD